MPDPHFHAYRKDLADVALAGRVIASHYARPVERSVTSATTLRTGPCVTSEAICTLGSNDPFFMLDDTLGWAWGYAGSEGRVGYLPSETLSDR